MIRHSCFVLSVRALCLAPLAMRSSSTLLTSCAMTSLSHHMSNQSICFATNLLTSDAGHLFVISALPVHRFELRLPRRREVNTPDGFLAFARRMQPYLRGFRTKWIDSHLPNRLIIDYDDYLTSPQRQLAKVIEFFQPTGHIDVQKIGWESVRRH